MYDPFEQLYVGTFAIGDAGRYRRAPVFTVAQQAQDALRPDGVQEPDHQRARQASQGGDIHSRVIDHDGNAKRPIRGESLLAGDLGDAEGLDFLDVETRPFDGAPINAEISSALFEFPVTTVIFFMAFPSAGFNRPPEHQARSPAGTT